MTTLPTPTPTPSPAGGMALLVIDVQRALFDPSPRPHEGDARFRKTTPDSFLRTGLAEWLGAQGVQRMVIAGCASEFCIDTSTRRAAGLGLAVTLAADAHTTHDKAHANAALIRAHHNATLCSLTSFGVPIRALPGAEIVFSVAAPGQGSLV